MCVTIFNRQVTPERKTIIQFDLNKHNKYESLQLHLTYRGTRQRKMGSVCLFGFLNQLL